MKISLSDHFTYPRLIRFVLPSVGMMLFTSVYSVVDGFFVSNFVGKTPFAAINLVWPFLMICGAVGFIIGTGGSALVSKTLGEGDREKAGRTFSFLVYVSVALGVVFASLGIAFLRPITVLLGATENMVDDAVLYGRIILCALPAFILQNVFQSFLVTAEKPGFGFGVTVAAGLTNMVLDALLVGVLKWGLAGAAVATAMSQTVGGVIPLVWFCGRREPLRLGKAKWDGHALTRTLTNGSSEFVTNISMSLVSMLYNYRLMEIAGEDGVAAYGVLMYVSFIFVAAFLGYSIGTAPLISYHYGAGNREELKNLFRKSLVIIGTLAVVLTALGEGLAGPLARLFVGYDDALCGMTVRAFILYSFSYLPAGMNIYGSSFFTALNDGLVSATISFARTFAFQIAAVLLLPSLMPVGMQLDGIWLSVTAAELASLCVTVWFLVRKRHRYRYA